MHPNYADIRSRIAADPDWFDEHAVPRYGEFHPDKAASPYLREVALAEIACQQCGRLFRVALSAVNVHHSTIAAAIQCGNLHYGDPPNVECCGAGKMMNSVPLRVLEYWKRHDRRYVDENHKVIPEFFREWSAWSRDSELEIAIPDFSREQAR